MATTPRISVTALSHAYEGRGQRLLALANVNLRVAEGEFVSIIGQSGCGKTTLLRIIGGLLQPSDGQVEIDGLDPREAQRRKAIGFVFQESSLLPWLSALDNVRLPLQVNARRRADGARTAQAMVDLVGLGEFAAYYPRQLSGGMRQRVALARALVFDPAILLMDEPLGSLDEITRTAMRYEILRVWQQTRKTVVMVTHSVAEAVAMSDRVLVMTGAPGALTGVVPIDLPRPRTAGIEHTPAFLECTRRVQQLLGMGGLVEAATP